jgi:uncharacterized protein YegP (UPF0339 family)
MNTFSIYRENRGADLINAGPWRWHLKASNGKIIAEGGEGYSNASDLVRTVRRHVVRDNVLLEEALRRSLKRAGLDTAGKVVRK